ncbi:hypothetical protein [Undibacterium fentianense]|nr:hypothetical protein [Undibacterium fentianense]
MNSTRDLSGLPDITRIEPEWALRHRLFWRHPREIGKGKDHCLR